MNYKLDDTQGLQGMYLWLILTPFNPFYGD